jgi:hypothetical protein
MPGPNDWVRTTRISKSFENTNRLYTANLPDKTESNCGFTSFNRWKKECYNVRNERAGCLLKWIKSAKKYYIIKWLVWIILLITELMVATGKTYG